MKKSNNDLTCRVYHILKTFQSQEAKEIAEYDIKGEHDIVSAAAKRFEEMGRYRKIDTTVQSSWEKMCCYFLDTSEFDCDVSLRNIVVYWLAFLNESDQKEWRIDYQERATVKFCLRNGLKYELRGDTMNSYATPVIGCLRSDLINLLDNEAVDEEKHFKERYQLFDKQCGGKIAWSAYILDQYPKFREQFENEQYVKSHLRESIDNYIRWNHTLGNFIPVPFHWINNVVEYKNGLAEFNSPRGTGATHDYWDRALMIIKDWYMLPKKDRNSCLVTLVKNKNSNVINCAMWLESFEDGKCENGWKNFIEKNYMEPFVDQNNEPKRLWMPDKKDRYEIFFSTTSALIQERGRLIADSIKVKLQNMSDDGMNNLAQKMCSPDRS